jgi:two-component system, chemotaxis family, chemotaxis protein CheY
MRVLVCDDDAGTRLIVKHLLVRKLGCEVVECVNGVEGLSAMAKQQFDLAIVDVNMPELNGIDFVEAVRDSPTLKDVCIVMLTSDRREEVVRQLLAMGVAGYIVKPLVPDVVVAKLEPILKSIVPASSILAGPLTTGI